MVVSKMASFAAKCRQLGPVGSVQALAHAARVKLDMAALEGLRLLFGFERWHARSPDSARPYRQQLASLVNDLRPNCVVEVGCGLGGILARIKADRRYGYDSDPAAIRAASFLHGDSVKFTVGGFEQIGEGSIDVLIAVNWIHEFSPELIERWITPLLPSVRYLLVDAIIPGSPGGYRHFHTFQFLDRKAKQISINAMSEPHRRFILWEMIR